MSERRFPGRACSIPAAREAWQVSRRCCASALISPTGKVYALSATRPSSVTPTSIEITSPSASSYGPGMPWTTIEFGDAQIEAG